MKTMDFHGAASYHTDNQSTGRIDGRGFFVRGKAEDAGGLTPTKDDNVATRKKDRPDVCPLFGFQYKFPVLCPY